MVRVGGDTSDGVGFCGVLIFLMTAVLNRLAFLGGGVYYVLARSLSEVVMVIPSEGCVSVWSDGGVVSVRIMPIVFACVMRWYVCGNKHIRVGAVGVMEVWFVFVGVGLMFSTVVPIFC